MIITNMQNEPISNEEICKWKTDFITFVKDERNSVERIMNKYLLFGIPYLYRYDENTYFELKEEISEHFKIQQTQVYVVGSAKLGFSISPNKRFKDMDEDSDIDVAIIDEKLFDDYWKRVYSLNIDLMSRSENDDFKYRKFVSYLFKGWVRPDCFPLKMSNEWFEYFKGLYGKYNRKVAVGIYRDNDFFMGYHRNNILKLREEIRDGV